MKALELSDPHGVRWVPDAPNGVGALVVGGSSGLVHSARAELLARHGVLAEAIQWFGGPGQPEGPYAVPLETFLDRVDDLARDCDRVVVVGTSFGAEAALLTGVHSSRVAAVAAFAPSDVVWAGVAPDGTVTSHWTRGGAPVPFVPFDEGWLPDSDPPAYAGLYRASRARFPEQSAAAVIPVERIARLLLVAGGDDRVWPSLEMAAAIEGRRAAHGLDTVLVSDASAGHRTVLPAEPVVAGGTRMQRGGNEGADRRLGAAAWPHVLSLVEAEGHRG